MLVEVSVFWDWVEVLAGSELVEAMLWVVIEEDWVEVLEDSELERVLWELIEEDWVELRDEVRKELVKGWELVGIML